jgi:hypothetical protein
VRIVAEANRGKELQLEFCEVTLIMGICTIVTQRGKEREEKRRDRKESIRVLIPNQSYEITVVSATVAHQPMATGTVKANSVSSWPSKSSS